MGSSGSQQSREDKGRIHTINNGAMSPIKLKRHKAWIQLAIAAKYFMCHQLSKRVLYFTLWKTELNQALLRKDKHISFCELRPEHRRQKNLCCNLRSIWLSKFLSEMAHTYRFGDRRGSTRVNEADF